MATVSPTPGFHGTIDALDGANISNNLYRTAAEEDEPQQSPALNIEQPLRTSSPAPLPLPNFVFPKPAPVSPLSPSSAPSSYGRSSGRRPLSATNLSMGMGERNNLDSSNRNSLPAFSFGMQSPPLSPQPRNIPARPGVHKRGTSEFIGGDGTTGSGLGLQSTSPSSGDDALPPPPASFGPPGGRRGHQHRRSAAISTNDLTMILKPNPPTRGNSAPNSPAGEKGYQHSPFPGMDPTLQPPNAEATSPQLEVTMANKNLRGKVEFANEIQIIPRPLSLVSSDSSSTVRPGHSVSNSMSSIVSGGTPSPPTVTASKTGLFPDPKLADPRPRTAEPILDRDGLKPAEAAPKRRDSLPLLSDVVNASGSSPSTPKSAKKWSFFGHETMSGESSPKSRPASASSSVKDAQKAPNTHKTPEVVVSEPSLHTLERTASRRSSVSRKPSKKQKKVRSWAGSILSRKSRQRSQKQKLSRRSPTPPLRVYTPLDEVSYSAPEETQATMPEIPELQTDFASWKPRKMPPQEESMSPVIDLDAALGPFNTPSTFGDDWDMSQRGNTRKRAMHSAAGIGGFAGPGMHYHRRAESAPEFENPRFGLHRLGSSSTMGMEDVFEEDEDEEWEDTKASSDRDSSTKATDADEDDTSISIDIKVVDSDGMTDDKSMDFDEAEFQRGVKRKGSGLSEGDRRHLGSNKSEHSTISLVDDPIQEESGSPVEIVDDSYPSRPDSRAHSSDSTATPPFRARTGKDLAPVEIQPFSLQPPYIFSSTNSTSPRSISQSSLPSPRSPFSYDTQRISTAPSSIADENAFQSLLLGEPGPELRMSVDDVPSLTSSNSTMTRDSSLYPGAGNPQFRDGQRSSSVSAAAVGRKRSSIASLSRLISSSHGERSKLSIESRAPSDPEGQKKEKTSKSKRISRLMQFWKPKEHSS